METRRNLTIASKKFFNGLLYGPAYLAPRATYTLVEATLAVFALVFFVPLSSAQPNVTPPGNAVGTPSGSYFLSDLESISLYSGKVNTVVPLVNVGGRGNAGYSMVYPIKDAQWLTEVEPTNQGNFPHAIDHPDNVINPTRTVFLRPFEFGTISFRYNARTPGCYGGGTVAGCYLNQAMVAVFTSADGTEYALYDEKRGGHSSWISGSYPNHSWSPALDRGLVFSAKDGSGWTFVADPPSPNASDYLVDDVTYQLWGAESVSAERSASGYLKNNGGTVIRFDNSRAQWIKDRNGNKTTFVYETSGTNATKLDKVLDANNRVTDIIYGSGYEQVVYLGTEGQSRTITIGHGSLQSRLAPGNALQNYSGLFPAYPTASPYSFGHLNGNPTYNPQVVSTITLPDNRAYGFSYNSYGELARIDSPSGSAVEYTYGAGVQTAYPSGQFGDLIPTNSNCNLNCLNTNVSIYRRLLERREYPNGGSVPKLKTTYGYYQQVTSTPTDIGKVREEQIDPSGNTVLTRTDHFFFGNPTHRLDPGSSSPLGLDGMDLSGREAKTDNIDPLTGIVLARKESIWNLGCRAPRTACGIGNQPVAWSPFVERTETSIYESTGNQYLIAKTEFAYDNYNNVTDIAEYDFGFNQAGTALLRKTHTDYVTDANYIGENAAHLRSLPVSSYVSTDLAANNKVSLTVFEYDNYSAASGDSNHDPLLARGGSVTGRDLNSHGAGFTYRGNPTAITRFGNAQAQSGGVTNYSLYDELGNVIKTKDANGNATEINFGDNFGTADNNATTPSVVTNLGGSSTFAFPTSTINPMGWSAYVQYDYFTGRPVNTEDANGVVSKTIYNDPLDRPRQVVTAVGTNLESQTSFNYFDAERRIETKSDLDALNDNLLKSESFYDGFGRTTESRKYEADGGYVASKTEYDPLSRPYKKSSPFRPSEINANNPILWTQTYFDALGRVTKLQTPDNTEVLTSYDGNRTLVTDQAEKRRISRTNALGQLKDVWEITAADQWAEPISFGNPAVNLHGYKTSYSYDPLDNLTTVNQGSQMRSFAYNSLSSLLTANNPESGLIQYQYDNNGNLTWKKDARLVETSYVYDALNRITNRNYIAPANLPSYQASPNVTYTYDDKPNAKGKLTRISTGAGSNESTTEYTTFDVLGHVTGSKQVTGTVTYGNGSTDSLMTYVYNLSGALVEQQYPSGRKVQNVLDSNGDLEMVKSRKNANAGYWAYADNFTYNAAGAVTAMQFGNGTWKSTAFNSRLQPTQIALGVTHDATGLLKLNYTYGTTLNNGDVLTQTITVPTVGINPGFTATQTYTYDSLNRLNDAKEMIGSTETWKQTFLYDRYGNRTFDTTQNRTTTIPAGCPTAVCNPSVNTSDNRLKTSDGYQFDNSGNTVKDAEDRAFIYDGENKQVEVRNSAGQTIGQYFYDGDGKRVKKYVPGTGETTVFVYDSFGKLIAEYSTIVEPQTTARINYLTNDHLGSARINTSRDGSVNARHDYRPFGEEIFSSQRTTGIGYLVNGDGIRKQFTGYERDNEIGLDFAQARIYAMSLGRFQSADGFVNDTNPRDSASWNLYAYVRNNPLLFVDPTGMVVETDFVDYDTGKITTIDDGRDQVITAGAKNIAKFQSLWNAGQGSPDARSLYYTALRSFEDSWHNLNLTGDQFRLLARTVYEESSGGYRESYGIVNVLQNRAAVDVARGRPGVYGLMDEVSNAQGFGIRGVNSTEYNTESGAAADQKRLTVHKAIARAITGVDITGGAFFWDGRDFNRNAGGNNSGWQFRHQSGYFFTNSSHDLYKQGNYRHPTRGYYYESTSTEGATTFSRRYNYSWGSDWR